MPIPGGLGTCQKQITFDYLDTVTGQVYAARSARLAGCTCAPA